MNKICTCCKQEKDISDFYRKNNKRYQSICKSCNSLKCKEFRQTHKEYTKNYNHKKWLKLKNDEHYKEMTRKYQENNKEKIQLKRKLYHEKNKELLKQKYREYYLKHKKRIIKRNIKWDKKNRHKKREYYKKYYNENKEYVLRKNKSWQLNNPEKYNDWWNNYKTTEEYRLSRKRRDRKRRALKFKVNEHYTPEDEQYTMALFNNKCINCGSTKNLCIDHHYPLSKGNPLTRNNAVLLCNICNVKKSNKSPENFYTEERLSIIKTLLKRAEGDSVEPPSACIRN